MDVQDKFSINITPEGMMNAKEEDITKLLETVKKVYGMYIDTKMEYNEVKRENERLKNELDKI